MNKTFCSKLKNHELRKDRIRSANFCLPLYKVVSYHLNFGIKQIAHYLLRNLFYQQDMIRHTNYTLSLFQVDFSNSFLVKKNKNICLYS